MEIVVTPARLRALKMGDEGEFAALVEEFMPIIRSRALRYRYAIPDFDDLCQIGRVALWRAVRDYADEVPFPAFAITRIHNRMIDAIREERAIVRRGSRWDGVSLDAPLTDDGDGMVLHDAVPDRAADEGLARMIVGEQLDALVRRIKTSGLSSLERHALILRALGYRQTEIAARLDTTPGSVNTALNRARKRLGIEPVASKAISPHEVVRLYRAGASGEEIATQYGCDARTIINICRRAAVPIRRRGENGSRSLFQTRLAA